MKKLYIVGNTGTEMTEIVIVRDIKLCKKNVKKKIKKSLYKKNHK